MRITDLPAELKIKSANLAARLRELESYGKVAAANAGTAPRKAHDDERFLFILGAGASVTSGIPMAYELVLTWYGESCGLGRSWWHDSKTAKEDWAKVNAFRDAKLLEYRSELERERRRQQATRAGELVSTHADELVASIGPSDPLDANNAASKYEETFRLLFRDNPEAGYQRLADAMRDGDTGRDKRPSIGYSFLASILALSRHNLVVTTNFDNLVADALARHQGVAARIYGHEAVIPHVGRIDHATVIKVHRDLHCAPKNDGLTPFEGPMAETLRALFRERTPIVVGYGGWDRSLMHFLERHVVGSRHRPGVFWCMRPGDNIPNHVHRMVVRAQGKFVEMDGFDELMLELAAATGYKLKDVLGGVRELAAKTNAELILGGLPLNRVDLREAFQSITDGDYWGDFAVRNATSEELFQMERLLEQSPAMNKEAKADGFGYLASGYAEKGERGKAEAYYKRALDVDSNHANHLGNYANLLNETRRFEEAEAHYKMALKADPKHANNLGNYAVLLKELDRKEEADAHYKMALEADPNHANNLGNYANLLSALKRSDEAETCYKRALEVDPRHANHLGNYAVLLKESKRYEEAETHYKRALEINPSHGDHLGNYANLLRDINRPEEAEAYYKRALEVNPNHGNHLGNFAIFLESRGRLLEAEDHYRRMLAIEPKSEKAIRGLVTLLHRQDRFVEEKAVYEAVLVEYPDHPLVFANLTQILFALGEDARAFATLEKAERLNGDSNAEFLELLFYRLAHDQRAGLGKLPEMKAALAAGVRSPGWRFATDLRRAKEAGHPQLELLEVLAAVITDGRDPADLDRFTEWRSAGTDRV